MAFEAKKIKGLITWTEKHNELHQVIELEIASVEKGRQ
jgi:hypothetical protein